MTTTTPLASAAELTAKVAEVRATNAIAAEIAPTVFTPGAKPTSAEKAAWSQALADMERAEDELFFMVNRLLRAETGRRAGIKRMQFFDKPELLCNLAEALAEGTPAEWALAFGFGQ